ncbi:phosphatidylinositol-specific phospholipase [Podospora aff. communis PSN243]|uniref:Phosphatidylinositol-specific phospholipase n=1 Tax=Podospora aff. communis PSN243 TaxID=3040156 RepID=A0AAV9GTM8_9PEZI|nr:phosphatidylinositol-specific phospholipase [Podospora aff. communis PSN243]
MSWVPHGPSNSGLVQASLHGQSKTVPAVATYRGELWCLWADLEGNSWYAVTGEEEGQFGDRIAFPQPGLPVMANLSGHLHAVIVLDTGELAHFMFDDEKHAWVFLGPLSGAITHSSPCLAAFRNQLFSGFVRDGSLQYAVWTSSASSPSSASNPSGTWSKPAKVLEGNVQFRGIPALFVLRGSLHLLCASDSSSREILCFAYNYTKSTWAGCEDISEGRAASGVSATSYGDKALLGFIENGPDDESHTVCVATFIDDKWQPHEMVADETAADPPQICILNGRIHCIFNQNTPSRDLRWYSRPLSSYSLSSWMSFIPDSTPLSRITIPGTHDSCARSNIPFVRTQYLSVTQQLRLGIRFLDLRLRLHSNSTLFCYHGGVPLNLPRRLPFTSVMTEVFNFLTAHPSETILISIDNDDPSPRDPPAFYHAVCHTISTTPSLWCTSPTTPPLSHARGRAVLLRRYAGDPTIPQHLQMGLDLSLWINNSSSFTIVTSTNIRIHIQDKWRFSQRISLSELIERKSTFVQQLMVKAAGMETPGSTPESSPPREGDLTAEVDQGGVNDWYINFCSAVGDPTEHGEIAEAKWVAIGACSGWRRKWVSGMNTLTREFLAEAEFENQGNDCVQETGQQPSGVRLGIVNLDYPELPEDNDLVARLIELNFLNQRAHV